MAGDWRIFMPHVRVSTRARLSVAHPCGDQSGSGARIDPIHGGVDTDASTLAACVSKHASEPLCRRQSPGGLPPRGVAMTLVSHDAQRASDDGMPVHGQAVTAGGGTRRPGAPPELRARLKGRRLCDCSRLTTAADGLPASWQGGGKASRDSMRSNESPRVTRPLRSRGPLTPRSRSGTRL